MSGSRTEERGAPAGLDAEAQLALYREIARIREFEDRAHRLFLQGLVKGTTHLSQGMEAVAVGVAAAQRPDDFTFCTYRGHAHTLARGASMEATMAELLGRATGLCGGKGGSMHLTSVEHGVMGSYAIVGAHLPIAAGAAWSAQLRGSDQVSVAFFGDGASNIGAFHEALNLAAVWKLPVVFVCENNQYMEYTSIKDVTAVERPAADRAASYGLEAIQIDGNDPEAVYDEASRAIARARAGGGPSLIEALTYRHGGHSRADPGDYRPADEVEQWLARDPLSTYRRTLLDRGVAEDRLAAIEGRARADVEAAVEAAKRAPLPEVASAFTEVWADGGSSWRT